MDSSNSSNNSKSSTTNNTCNSKNNSTSQDNGIGLQNLSYADFIVLSSVLSYAIAEELNDIDLDLFIVFLGMIQSDMATLRIQRGLKNNGALNATIDTTDTGVKESTIQPVRHSSTRMIKRVKKKRRKMIKNKENKQ
ncbi:MAG: hypothetical protein ACRC92_08570 [Peptostreptococcaceae bacterium]